VTNLRQNFVKPASRARPARRLVKNESAEPVTLRIHTEPMETQFSALKVSNSRVIVVSKWPDDWKLADIRNTFKEYYQQGGFWVKSVHDEVHLLFEDEEVCWKAWMSQRNNVELVISLAPSQQIANTHQEAKQSKRLGEQISNNDNEAKQSKQAKFPPHVADPNRPPTTNRVAHRLIAGALGLSPKRVVPSKETAKIEKATHGFISQE